MLSQLGNKNWGIKIQEPQHKTEQLQQHEQQKQQQKQQRQQLQQIDLNNLKQIPSFTTKTLANEIYDSDSDSDSNEVQEEEQEEVAQMKKHETKHAGRHRTVNDNAVDCSSSDNGLVDSLKERTRTKKRRGARLNSASGGSRCTVIIVVLGVFYFKGEI